MSKLHQCTDDELQQAVTVAQQDGDERSEQALLAELQKRQELLALDNYALNERYGEAATIADRPLMHRIDRIIVERVIEEKNTREETLARRSERSNSQPSMGQLSSRILEA